MNIAFYNGVSGMVTHQQNMDIIANNIANTNTVGYKTSRPSFTDLLYTKMYVNTEVDAENGQQEGAEDLPDSDGIHLTGHGVKMIDTDLIMTPGTYLPTGHPLDFAIRGQGFFAVERSDGSIEYTRNGAFNIGMRSKKGYLTTSDGSFVLDSKYKRIELERDDKTDLFDFSELTEEIGVFEFPNPYGLEPVSGGFRETAISGEADDVPQKRSSQELVSGALEQSAVDLSQEMTNVILAQRAFQFNAKMVQTADQIEEIVNNLR